MWQSGLAQTLPMNGVFINGLRVDLGGNTFNVFDLLAEVRTEPARNLLTHSIDSPQ